MSDFLSIQVENTLHIMPSDEADLHSLVEPCFCKPVINDSFSSDYSCHGIMRFVIHNNISGEPA